MKRRTRYFVRCSRQAFFTATISGLRQASCKALGRMLPIRVAFERAMHSPTPDQLAVLEGFERTAFAIVDKVNRQPALKRVSQVLLQHGGASWVYHCVKN